MKLMILILSCVCCNFLVSGILETVWDKHSVSVTTPPPSPTSRETGESCADILLAGAFAGISPNVFGFRMKLYENPHMHVLVKISGI